MSDTASFAFPRRQFLKAGGALVVGTTVGARTAFAQGTLSADGIFWSDSTGPAEPDPDQLDTWIAVHADNTATIFIGHTELGQGISTTLLQIAAEELDLEMAQVKTVALATGKTPNQGGTAASIGISRGGIRIRHAAAEARQVLLRLASERLGVPVDRLTVSQGVVSRVGNPGQSVTYGELIGERRFNVPYTGRAPIKDYRTHRIVGTRVPRRDIPDKARGTHTYMHQVRVAGMLHGRVVRPRGQGSFLHGAPVKSVDADSIRNIPGARVIRRGDFVGVVAPDEWSAVRAAQQLRVVWDLPPALPASSSELYERMRAAKTIDQVVLDRGDVGAAFAKAAHVVSGRFDTPYQMHGPVAPNCAIADVKVDSALMICSVLGIYGFRNGLARLLKLSPEKVTVQYYEAAASFGGGTRTDVAMAAAILSQEAGAPVRLQFMRWDDHGWDTYQPAHTADVKMGVDGSGTIVAYEYHGWQHTWGRTDTTMQLAAGEPAAELEASRAQYPTPFNTGDMYALRNWRIVNHRVPGLNGYFRSGALRSPLDLAIAFGAEQMIDQLAYLAEMDPYLFRQRNISTERWRSVLDAVAKAANWTPRRAGTNRATGRLRPGRGIGLGTHLSSHGAAVAEVELDTDTGVIVVKRMYGAIEAGQAINPGIIEQQIVGMMCQAASRALKEEVTFSRTNVTSLDWTSYPTLRFGEAPEVTAICVKRQDEPSTGAGEEALAAGVAAIANAVFDATGVRLHEMPMTPARMLAALKTA